MFANLDKIVTRREAAAELESAGVSGAAAALLLGDSAPARHAHRVAAAKEAAISAANAHLGIDRDDFECRFDAALILLADIIGVGGRADLDGAATTRHPGLQGLGKGRKRACDGGAWSAAIEQAARELLIEQCGHSDFIAAFVPQNGKLALECTAAGKYIAGCSAECVALRWQRAIAAAGLRAIAGSTEQRFDVYAVGFGGGVEEWAALFNALSEKMAQASA